MRLACRHLANAGAATVKLCRIAFVYLLHVIYPGAAIPDEVVLVPSGDEVKATIGKLFTYHPNCASVDVSEGTTRLYTVTREGVGD